MIDRHHDLSIIRQARLVGISRSSVYYTPKPVSDADLALMRRIDALHMNYPFAGSRLLRRFNAQVFVDAVKSRGCQLSMDGRGAWRDNVFAMRSLRDSGRASSTRRCFCTPATRCLLPRRGSTATSISITQSDRIQALARRRPMRRKRTSQRAQQRCPSSCAIRAHRASLNWRREHDERHSKSRCERVIHRGARRPACRASSSRAPMDNSNCPINPSANPP